LWPVTDYIPRCILDLSPEIKAALLVEIEKALPGLLRKAIVAARKKSASGGAPRAKRQRLPNGAPKVAILRAIRAFHEEGADRKAIKRLAVEFLKGAELSDHTLKRWLYELKKAGEIDLINGRWFWQPDGNVYRGRAPRDFGQRDDDYQEKNDLGY